jgi:hypothetical protein
MEKLRFLVFRDVFAVVSDDTCWSWLVLMQAMYPRVVFTFTKG